ncbi:iron chelate uptake ABC transporter family permease subunit [Brachybacterium sp. DNPG3]
MTSSVIRPARPAPRVVRRGLAAGVLALALASCAPAVPEQAAAGTASDGGSASASAGADASADAGATVTYPVTVENCGREVTLDSAPQRVVGVEGAAETLFALGVADQTVGYFGTAPESLPDDLAAQAEQTEHLGSSFPFPTAEQVIENDPDLVVLYGFGDSGELAEQLDAQQIPYLQLSETCDEPDHTVEGYFADVETIATALGDAAAGEELVAQWRSELPERTEVASDAPTVVVYGNMDPSQPFVSGAGSFVQDQLDYAGGINSYADSPEGYLTPSWGGHRHPEPRHPVLRRGRRRGDPPGHRGLPDLQRRARADDRRPGGPHHHARLREERARAAGDRGHQGDPRGHRRGLVSLRTAPVGPSASPPARRPEPTAPGTEPTTRRSEPARRRTGPVAAAIALTVVSALLALVGLVVSGAIGTEPTSLAHVLEIAYRRAWGIDYVAAPDRLVSELRLPRGVLALLVGAALALVGCILQAVVRNPLADSSVLGGTAGAGLGAVAAIALLPGALSLLIPLGAFVGAAVGFAITLVIATAGGGFSPLKLILAGVATSYVLGALTQYVLARAGDDRKLRSAIFWQMGSVAGAQWADLVLPLVVLLSGAAYLLLRARRLDQLAFGDLTARSLGLSPALLRVELIVVCAVMVGTCVAAAGGIGFVSLVVPHICRLLVGSAHGRLLPAATALGAAFLVWADVLARVATRPSELPIGVVTALVGGVGFAILLITRTREDA